MTALLTDAELAEMKRIAETFAILAQSGRANESMRDYARDISRLLAHIRALQAENARLRAALEKIAQDEDCQYGFFPGGDPRKFSPDVEDCTEAERAAHKEACRVWDEAEAAGRSMNPEEPSGS